MLIMAEVCSASIANEQIHKSFSSKEFSSEGILKGEGKEYTVFVYAETESVSKGVSEFLGEMQAAEAGEFFQFEAVWITPSEIQLYVEIQQLMQELGPFEQAKSEHPNESKTSLSTPSRGNDAGKKVENKSSTSPTDASSKKQTQHIRPTEKSHFSSIFSMSKALSMTKAPIEGRKEEKGNFQKKESQPFHSPVAVSQPRETIFTRLEREQQREKNDEGKQGGQEENNQKKDQEKQQGRAFSQNNIQGKKNEKKKPDFVVAGVQGSRSSSKSLPSTHANASSSSGSNSSSHKTNERLQGVENIYIRFMALMARILGQAEAEAHDLYQRIKHRTDDIDTLTHFISQINSAKGKIDWSKDEEMKQLLEKVRALGVEIPAGKYTWTDDEKKMLKENVQMKKDSMEKITQLERTDMQRYLQEASQCHQARSNVLKLLKEVMDTIIANMRP